MNSELKTAAETRRALLVEYLVSLDSVRTWADEYIAILSDVPDWLITVSMAKRVEEAVAGLAAAPGTANAASVWSATMRAWLTLLDAEPERDSDIAKALYFMGSEGRSPIPGIDNEMMWFWDAIDLARDGAYSHRETERGKLRDFLARWSGDAAAQQAVAADGAGPGLNGSTD